MAAGSSTDLGAIHSDRGIAKPGSPSALETESHSERSNNLDSRHETALLCNSA